METNEITSSAQDSSPLVPPDREDHFYPVGAMVFFILLVLLCLAIWFGIYSIMLNRS